MLDVWVILCVALFWSVFCRSVLLNTTAKTSIRLAVWVVGLASLMGMAAPVYGWKPDLVSTLMLASFVFMQVVMAQLWHGGVPHPFRSLKHKYNRRTGDSRDTSNAG